MYNVGIPVYALRDAPAANVYIETRCETDGVSWPDVRYLQLVHFSVSRINYDGQLLRKLLPITLRHHVMTRSQASALVALEYIE